MPRVLVPILGLIGLVLLCLVCVQCHAPRIQNDLTEAGRRALSTAGYNPVLLRVDGRDAILIGRVPAERDRLAIAELAGALPGVRTVYSRLTTGDNLARPGEPILLADAVAGLAQDVEFQPDSAALTPTGRAVLDQVHDLLTRQPTARLAISAHTDNQGDAVYNMDLSRQRAEAARDYLVGKGLARARFETAGYGATRPVADNATLQGRQWNRRIELQVLEASE
ncbi:MAG: OmpA family protein [Acidobacteriota bacterium]